MKLTRYAVERKWSTLSIVLALFVLGMYGFWRLSVDFLPSVTYPMIKIHIWWRGATPEEIEKNIADPIERQMATVDDLDYLESSSIEGMYTLLVNFRYGVDVNVAYQDTLAAMARVSRDLPKDMDPPIVIKADPSQLPVLQMTVSSDQWDLVKLRTWAEEWLQERLLTVPGVAGTEIVGGLKREIRVHLDADSLEKYGLSLPDVLRRLREENLEQFAGRVTSGPKEIIARTVGEFKNLREIESVVLFRKGSSKIYLRDVARVLDAHEEARVITRLGGKPCVKLSVLKQDGANTVEVAQAVTLKMRELSPSLPLGMKLGIVENQADYVENALSGVKNSALQAIVLLIVIVYLFLGSWRQVLVMAIVLPITVVLNFGLMKLSGFSLNIFSLGGLVIAIGVLLDNSTVVIENVSRWKIQAPTSPLGTIAIEGTTEVGPSILAATLAFLALFLPFLIVQGLVTLLFRELILVIAGIVTISLLVAMSVTPMLTSVFLPSRSSEKSNPGWFERLFHRITQGYGWSLKWALRGRWAVLGASVAGLALAVWWAGGLGNEFLPKMDDGRIMVKVKLPTGSSLEETDRLLTKIEREIAGDPSVESCFTLVGGKVWGLYTYEIANEGEANLQLVPRSKRKLSTKAYIQRLRPLIEAIPVPGGKAMVMQMPVKGIRKLGDADIEVKIKGQEISVLYALAQKVAGEMNRLQEFTNVYISIDMTKPEYQLLIDREKASELGVSVSEIAGTMKSLISGAVATRYRDGDEYYNIRVMIPEKEISSRQQVENIPLHSLQGHLRIKDVARVLQAVGPVEIVREDQVKQVVIRGDSKGNVGIALAGLKKALAGMEIPAGYDIKFGGEAQMIQETTRVLLLVLVFSVFFAFIILTVQFDSVRMPTMILGSVPFCFIGFIAALYLTHTPLGATVIIGILIVVASAINDGVLLFTFADELQVQKKLSSSEAILQSAQIRLRPRVMTTVSTLVGLIPLALNLDGGGEMLQPMAIGAIGGLLAEILVALYLMPCLFTNGKKPVSRA